LFQLGKATTEEEQRSGTEIGRTKGGKRVNSVQTSIEVLGGACFRTFSRSFRTRKNERKYHKGGGARAGNGGSADGNMGARGSSKVTYGKESLGGEGGAGVLIRDDLQM